MKNIWFSKKYMGRILAIDYGGKRTGLAATDPSRIIASPLETVETTKLTPYLKEYIPKNKVDQIVVGYPTNPNGDENPILKQIRLFTDNLKKLFPDIPMAFYDEQYTSKEAMKMMVAGNFGKKYRAERGNTDKMAAALILQGWMEENGI